MELRDGGDSVIPENGFVELREWEEDLRSL